ncbi:MAG: EAL domain-containing protein, partial [Chromatiales bacterium]
SYDRRFVVLSAVTADQMEALTLPYYQTAWATGVLVILAIFIISGLASRYRLRGILAVQRLREAERDQRVILETVGEGIIGVDRDARLTFVNSRAVELTGYTAEEMMGSDLGKVIKIHDEEKKVSVTESSSIQNCLFDAATCRSDKEVLRHKSGASFPVEYICNPITRDGHLIGAVVSFLDITERKDAERHIQHLVLYDALTDIPNRTLLTDRLSQQIAIAKQTQKIGALLYIDIDRFKQINDAIGHAQGDNILTEVAKRLNEIVQKGDTIARIDSDEFVLLQAAKALSTEQAAHDAQLAAYDVMLALEQPYWVNGEAIRLTASIGIAIYPGTDDDVTAVLSKADTAAARAKSAGRNTSRFFTDDMERDTKGWFSIHNRLLEALANDTFTMAYQPLVRQNGKVIGLEALLRWEDPVLGKVSPTEFVTIAEESGLILQLSDIVLSKVCQQIREWMDAGLGETIGRVAINISATLFAHKDFVVYVSNHLERTGIPPNAIELEITERALVSDILDTRRKVDRLRQIGVHFSIDDFGTGYSSLSYLQQLPIDRLKIDRSFITEVNKRQNQQTIVKAIIQLAKGLSLEVIAEGVESEDEMRYLLDTGCSEFQGYYFSYPKSGTDLTDLLKRKSLARRLH